MDASRGFRRHSLRKYLDEYVVQGDYGQGWQDVNTETDRKAGEVSLIEYHLNETQAEHRLITRRVPNPDHGRFYVGQKVRVRLDADAWMMGFTCGTVVSVGTKYVHVAWFMNDKIVRPFWPQFLAPADGES